MNKNELRKNEIIDILYENYCNERQNYRAKKKKSMVSQVQEQGNRNELLGHRVLLGFMKVFCVIL